MKHIEKSQAIKLREKGHSLNYIASKIGVSKSSVSLWVKDVKLNSIQLNNLKNNAFTTSAIEKRREARLLSEEKKRIEIINSAKNDINKITHYQLLLIGTMLYWAEGGKTQRMVRFSNGDPRMIQIMMRFFREICKVPENKFRGYIHIHQHLDTKKAEKYWSKQTNIPLNQFYKTYNKPNKSSTNKKNTLPYGVLDVYVLDVKLFLKITGWASAIFEK